MESASFVDRLVLPAVPRLREPMDRLIAWMMLMAELSCVIARLRLALGVSLPLPARTLVLGRGAGRQASRSS